MNDTFIGEYSGYQVYLTATCQQVVYKEGKKLTMPVLEAPPQLTVALMVLSDKYPSQKYTSHIGESYQHDFHHYLYEISPLEHRIMINRRLLYLNCLIEQLLKDIRSNITQQERVVE